MSSAMSFEFDRRARESLGRAHLHPEPEILSTSGTTSTQADRIGDLLLSSCTKTSDL